MRNLKYITYLLGIALLLPSCSKDDEEVAPKADDNAQVGLFAEDSRTIEVPTAMAESDNEYALQASAFVQLATGFANYSSYFEVPPNAEQSETPISASNARIAASAYLVYTWSQNDVTVAYQFSKQDDKEVFEIFLKRGDKDFYKLLEVTQAPDGQKGTINWYGQASAEAVLTYTWEITSEENYYITFFNSASDEKVEVVSNKDKSGSVKYYEGEILKSEMEWTGDGNGSWVKYNEDGTINIRGTWTVS